MYLRVKDGRYRGEVREFPYLVAKGLLDAGRAENAYADPVPAAPKVQAAAVTPAETQHSRRQRRRSSR